MIRTRDHTYKFHFLVQLVHIHIYQEIVISGSLEILDLHRYKVFKQNKRKFRMIAQNLSSQMCFDSLSGATHRLVNDCKYEIRIRVERQRPKGPKR